MRISTRIRVCDVTYISEREGVTRRERERERERKRERVRGDKRKCVS